MVVPMCTQILHAEMGLLSTKSFADCLWRTKRSKGIFLETRCNFTYTVYWSVLVPTAFYIEIECIDDYAAQQWTNDLKLYILVTKHKADTMHVYNMSYKSRARWGKFCFRLIKFNHPGTQYKAVPTSYIQENWAFCIVLLPWYSTNFLFFISAQPKQSAKIPTKHYSTIFPTSQLVLILVLTIEL